MKLTEIVVQLAEILERHREWHFQHDGELGGIPDGPLIPEEEREQLSPAATAYVFGAFARQRERDR